MGDDQTRADDVLRFWLEEAGPKRWYAVDPAFDRQIAARFGPVVDRAAAGLLDGWAANAEGALAVLILLDQFTRNIHRGDAAAFASDWRARALAKRAIGARQDLKVKEPERQFFYLPLMHSENPADQARCVRLFMLNMPETGGHNLIHAIAHREEIRRFGRFPGRNEALGREATKAEIEHLAKGGYARLASDAEAVAAT